MLKKFIPKRLKIQLKQNLRQITDWQKGYVYRWAKEEQQQASLFPHTITIKQPIFQSALFENKLHNIRIASQRIESLIIHPQEIVSFWKAVGIPNHQNGFKKGRNIIAGQLQEGYGGGLCQISGMIYHLALIAGLNILERHNHSIDIYKETERYTPLGADATVVYGYKDLRIINNQTFPIQFKFSISEKEFIGHLYTLAPIKAKKIIFEKKILGKEILVTTKQAVDKKKIMLSQSIYLRQ